MYTANSKNLHVPVEFYVSGLAKKLKTHFVTKLFTLPYEYNDYQRIFEIKTIYCQ